MSIRFIIVYLLFQLFHHGFAGGCFGTPKATNTMIEQHAEVADAMIEQHAEVTDAMMKKHTEALRAERWEFKTYGPREKGKDRWLKVEHLSTVLSELPWNHSDDAFKLVSLVIEHMMKPEDPSFPSVNVRLPTAETSQVELEFYWEAVELTSLLLQGMTQGGAFLQAREPTTILTAEKQVLVLKQKYWRELRKLVRDAMFGPSPAIKYLPGQAVDWISMNTLILSEIVRGAKALYFLKHSDYSPVSSFTECHVFLNDLRTSTPAGRLYWSLFECPEHLLYRELYSHMVAQRGEFIKLACSRFLEEHRKFAPRPDPRVIWELNEAIGNIKKYRKFRMEDFSSYKIKKSQYYFTMPENVQGYLQHVTSEIVNLKEQMGRKDYQWDHDTVARISKIMAATPPPLAFVPQGLPFEITPLFEQLPRPENVHLQETSPYLAFAEEYHLLLLWRCMQELSLLQWFKNRFDAKLTPENPGFTSEQVNGAITEMTDKAEFSHSTFDAYEKVAGGPDDQPHPSRLSDEEKEQCLGLIVRGRNHLVGTWKDILEKKVNEYIMYVERALKNVKNFDTSAGVDSLDYIQHVDGIPPQVHHLISAYPVPENLQPSYLKLATRLHRLVVDRLYKAATSSKLWNYLQVRSQVFAAYEKAATNVDVGVLPDMRGYSLGQMGSPSTLAARDQVSPNTVAQRDILDPGSSIYSGPYGSIEYGLGTRSRADFEGGSSSGGSPNSRNRFVGGRSDVGDWSGFEHLG
ncbi:hypothetical protein SeMB42_g04951 [Synchytrium endobioticum]|uniref:Uncharacterized protein n=1 Tax=Synchytrium endobioticum TaxID=286115 RepID=A0A507CUP4_9FUNG|nr:hypothetical protein SeMB42_g04951 [Synchytrium endobioticum]